jgi:Protein of unknown function (DUF2804)
VIPALPYRGAFGAPRPAELSSLALPPAPMPSRHDLRPLKAWRYVGIFGPELMLCLAAVRIGPARQTFWAVWDRPRGRLDQATSLSRNSVWLSQGRARLLDRAVQLDLKLEEMAGVETVCEAGDHYAWTRKQGGVRAHGLVVIGGEPRELEALAVIDDTAAYYPRHTVWRWSAGVGDSVDGRSLAWNLVAGVNDPPRGSERTLWVDGEPHELAPARFDSDLVGVDDLRFSAEAERAQQQNLLLLRSHYRQPFGTFTGTIAGHELAAGYGVMEEHDVWW